MSTPIIRPNGGWFTGSVLVSFECATDGVSYYYTTDGTEPTIYSTPYTGPFYLYNSATVKVFAVKAGWKDSTVVSATFNRDYNGGYYPDYGGGIVTPTVTYPVSMPSSVPGGTVTVSSKNPAKGSTVTITVKPDSGYRLDYLTVTDASGANIPLVDKGDNKYTFVMPDSKVTLDYAFVSVEAPIQPAPTQPTASANPFTDVPAGAYYAGAVAWAVANNITTGTSATTFSPNADCTRAQIVTFLYRAMAD